MITWKDATSYSHGERGKKDPTCWEANIGTDLHEMRIVAVQHHLSHPGRWVFHCYQLDLDTVLLPDATNADEAKQAALLAVRQRLEGMLAALISA